MGDAPQGVVVTVPSLVALSFLVAAIAFLAFSVGVYWGGRDAALPAADFTSEVPTEALVDLLARVEAAAQDEGAVRKLTYPEELLGVLQGPSLPVGSEAQPTARQLEVQLSLTEDVPREQPPEGPFWAVLGRGLAVPEAERLRDRLGELALEVHLAVELRGGVGRASLVVGGFGAEEDGQAWVSEHRAELDALGLNPEVHPSP